MQTQSTWANNILWALIAVWAVMFCRGALAQQNACDFPRNNVQIPATAVSGIRKATFDAAVAAVYKVYAPVVRAAGGTLVINNRWDDPEVNATAYRYGALWYVDAYGGLARHPGMTKGGYLTVLCHEIGHHLGGRPKYSDLWWASVEGQSDYWAEDCMRRVAPALARAGGQALGNVLASLNGESRPSYATPDPTRVDQTLQGHPNAQCRLDTYLAGIKRWPRPLCWYAPGLIGELSPL